MDVYPQNPWPFYHWSLGGIAKSLVLGSFAKGLFPIKRYIAGNHSYEKVMRRIQCNHILLF